MSDFDELVEKSVSDPSATFVVFKHSSRCSISDAAKGRMEREWESVNPSVAVYFLDLITYRELSNYIASKIGVKHESPQLVIISKGKCIADYSHFEIRPSCIQL
ncbi:MAG TPA: bacillithiol system redox-active protein YtxJ [Flavobacteriales bacterium]|nr:bacillithiol system redox-active protein YtxJ [Flavobacteriales bacterium]